MSPTPTVADLMSRGVQTLDPNATLTTVIRRMRLIGHEGYPVVAAGRVVGLLTRRDADRALEHGLGDLTVRDVMFVGEVTLRPDDPVDLLERLIVETGWGQIPVLDSNDALIGIVTRTDLIKYWARVHVAAPSAPAETTTSPDEIAAVLGQPVADLIDRIAQHAQSQSISLYMVGGIVRDLLLKRPNVDLDFVVEGDGTPESEAEAAAIRFAERLQARYGGVIHSYRPFGTATWTLDNVNFDTANLPAHVDFATARSEFYEHPTALPTVYNGSIKLDLLRRDFTINTLAVQWSPAASSGRVLDFYGGLLDLRAGLIRVLHSLSFVDDPTRILRAVRFERRLGFRIEPRTAQLIDTALPMLRRITGERTRNELALLLAEADPGAAFLLLQDRAILTAIHPAFVVPADLPARLERARAISPPWSLPPPDPTDLAWCVLLATIPPPDLADLCARLLFSKALADAVLDTARLVQNPLRDTLNERDLPPSRVVALFDGIADLALFAAWLIADPQNSSVRERIRRYASEWRAVRPVTDGYALRARGLAPGPCYARILARLRAARLDGEIPNADDGAESRLLDRLIKEGICNDGAQ